MAIARKRPKTVRQKKRAITSKIPRRSPSVEFRFENPAWRLSILDEKGPFGWHEISGDKLSEIREKLANFEKMTWSEILIKGKYRNHTVSLDQICVAARSRLRKIKQDDIDELVSLRFSSKERVWGIRNQEVLNLLWWDPKHAVCPSPKKHT